MAVELRETQQCVDFFQQTILRTVDQWKESPAVQEIDVPTLDRNRLTITNLINRGLEYEPAWCILKPLIIAFTPYMERRGHWEIWRPILQKSIEVAKRKVDVGGELTLTSLLARLSQRQSRGNDVVRYYRRVIRLAKRHGNQYEEARACSNLGYYYIESGHWWRAEVLSCHALGLFEESESKHGQAHTHNHLGVLYTRMGEREDADTNLTAACRLWRRMGDKHSLIYGLENLGGLCNDADRPEDALSYLFEALELVEHTGENAEKGTILNNIGNSYLILEDYDAAKNHLEMAEQTHRQYSNPDGLAHVWHNSGVLAMKKHQFDEAENLLQDSVYLHQDMGNWKERDMAMFDLIECLIAKGDLQQAREYLEKLSVGVGSVQKNRHGRLISQQLKKFRHLLNASSF